MPTISFEQSMSGLSQYLFAMQVMPDEDDELEGDWNDEEDEDFDDRLDDIEDLNEIRAADDMDEPDPEDDDHLPDDDLQ
ncbi:MAG: hypothetical protein ABI367_16225 [Mucilaginibacter sp.]